MKKIKTKPFSRMTRAEKRVAIAKDAIAQIRAKKLRVAKGNYIITPGNYESISQANVETVALRRVKPCQVCQIGQAIVCGIRLFNTVESDSSPYASEAFEIVQTWFTGRTAMLMERAFEGWHPNAAFHGVGDGSIPANLLKRAHAFYKKYPNRTKRSIAIWKNIIKNNGEFVP